MKLYFIISKPAFLAFHKLKKENEHYLSLFIINIYSNNLPYPTRSFKTQEGLDAFARSYDRVVKDPALREQKSDTGNGPILVASEAKKFRSKSNAPCFSSKRLDVESSILWILGEQVGIQRSFLSYIGPVVVGNFSSLEM